MHLPHAAERLPGCRTRGLRLVARVFLAPFCASIQTRCWASLEEAIAWQNTPQIHKGTICFDLLGR
jgi:hypothetical protein